MNCPNCQAKVDAAHVSSGLAQCQWCDHIWTLEPNEVAALARQWAADRKRAPHEIDPGVRPPTPRPDCVELTPMSDGVTLTIPWTQDFGIKPHVFLLLATAIFGGIAVFAAIEAEPVGVLVFGAVALAFAMNYLYFLLNRTVLRVTSTGVETTHGPLPALFDPDLQLRAGTLSTLSIEQTTFTYRGRVTHHYTLRAGGQVLMRKFYKVEVVTYVAEVIAGTLGSPVRIHYHPE